LDFKEAVRLFRLAANGEAKAKFNGVMYAEGKGVPQEFRKPWVVLLGGHAEDADAYHNLGVMYATRRRNPEG
jgi:TPR repeat protein